MSTRGFEFYGNISKSNATPVIRDFILSTAVAHAAGDLVCVASDGDVTQVTGTTTEVTGVMQETIAAADITAGTTTGKVAIITRNQIWKCSSDASTATTTIIGYIKTLDTADCNTIDADDITNGSMILLDKSATDDDGNLIFQVVFADTTFGNA